MLIMFIAFLKKWEKKQDSVWYHNSCHTGTLTQPLRKSGHKVIELIMFDLCYEVIPTFLVPTYLIYMHKKQKLLSIRYWYSLFFCYIFHIMFVLFVSMNWSGYINIVWEPPHILYCVNFTLQVPFQSIKNILFRKYFGKRKLEKETDPRLYSHLMECTMFALWHRLANQMPACMLKVRKKHHILPQSVQYILERKGNAT